MIKDAPDRETVMRLLEETDDVHQAYKREAVDRLLVFLPSLAPAQRQALVTLLQRKRLAPGR